VWKNNNLVRYSRPTRGINTVVSGSSFGKEMNDGVVRKKRSLIVCSSKNVAASAGFIMDACSYTNSLGNLVQGSAYVTGNGDFWISIRGSG
jgi:hypothetical protein